MILVSKSKTALISTTCVIKLLNLFSNPCPSHVTLFFIVLKLLRGTWKLSRAIETFALWDLLHLTWIVKTSNCTNTIYSDLLEFIHRIGATKCSKPFIPRVSPDCLPRNYSELIVARGCVRSDTCVWSSLSHSWDISLVLASGLTSWLSGSIGTCGLVD